MTPVWDEQDYSQQVQAIRQQIEQHSRANA
jgi:hypothetical protein